MDETTKEGQKEKVITKWATGYARESKEKADLREAVGIKAKDFVSTSISYQEQGMKEQSKIDGLNLVKIFKDVDVQSTKVDRPEFNKMLEFIDSNKDKIKKVYIKTYSRLGRGQTFFTLRRKLIAHGISKEDIFFWHENSSNRINFEDDSMIGIRVYADLMRIEQNRKEYQKMQQRKRKDNIPYVCPSYGYKWSKDKDWRLDTKKAEIVKQVFQLTKEGKNYKEISKAFKISQRLYYKIVRNKTYTGVISHKQKIKDDEGTILRIEQTEYKGKHQAIIPLSLFEEVQSILNKRMWIKKNVNKL